MLKKKNRMRKHNANLEKSRRKEDMMRIQKKDGLINGRFESRMNVKKHGGNLETGQKNFKKLFFISILLAD